MSIFKHVRVCFFIAAISVLTILAIGLISEVSADTKGFDSPEAVFKNLVEASNAKDFQKLCGSIAPDDMATINVVMIVGGSMIVAFAKMGADIFAETNAGTEGAKPEVDLKEKEKAKKAADEANKLEDDFKTILNKHKVEDIFKDDAVNPASKDEKESREYLATLFKDINQCALLSDLFGFFDKMPGEKSQKSSWSKPECSELKDIKVEGDTATAMCGAEKLSFRKLQNRWYINPEEAGRTKKISVYLKFRESILLLQANSLISL